LIKFELRDGESKESVSLFEVAFCGKTEFKTELDPLVEAANFRNKSNEEIKE
jgi:hypothetical protein